MKRLKNIEVVRNFVARMGGCQSHNGNLTSANGKLYSYNTVIAQYIDGKLYLNATKYSQSTYTIQNMVRREAYSYIEVTEYVRWILAT
jgi:hypothetical protein